MLAKRLSFKSYEAEAASEIIARRLSIFMNYRDAQTVMLYMPIKGEVSTYPIINMCLTEGKRVIVPVIKDKEIVPCLLESLDDMETGEFNVLVPSSQISVPLETIDLICIPGVAFTEGCYRLGYGGGYYDRFLPRLNTDCFKVGIAFDFQVLHFMAVEEHDYKLDMVLTEERFIGSRLF